MWFMVHVVTVPMAVGWRGAFSACLVDWLAGRSVSWSVGRSLVGL